jgi:catechol 2,3-dioxygenase-like lactoylglutathione lyase family enzyme
MSTAELSGSDGSGVEHVAHVDLRLEVVVIPVSDVDRAKAFYGGLGWRLDADFQSTPLKRHSRPSRTWRARFGGRRPRTASTRSAPGGQMRTGPSGMPRTWQRSRRAKRCRHEQRLRATKPDA